MEKGKGREERNHQQSKSQNQSQKDSTSFASREDEKRYLTIQEDRREIDQGIDQKLSLLHEQKRELLSSLYRTEIEKQILLNARILIDERLQKVQHQQYLARAAGLEKGKDEVRDASKGHLNS